MEWAKQSTVPRLKNTIDFSTMNALIWQFLALEIALGSRVMPHTVTSKILITAANKGDYGAYFQQVTSFYKDDINSVQLDAQLQNLWHVVFNR